MRLASILICESRPRHPGGRPRDASNPGKRATQYRWAYLVLSDQARIKEAAAANGVHRNTIHRWIRELLASGEPEAEGLRRVVGDSEE